MCAAQCSKNPLCAYWSWRSGEAFQNPYGCWLKSACTATIPSQNIISGAASCLDAGGAIIG